MKSSSNVRPDIIQDLGNGSFHYNYNIVEEKVADEEVGEKTVYNFDTVQVWEKPTYENLTRAVIRNEVDENEEFTGKVTEVNPSIDEKGQVKIRARIRNRGNVLMEGMNVKVVIEKEVPDMFVVPKDAVVMRDGFHVLFRLEEGRAVWTYVDVVYSNISQYAVTGNARKETKIEDGDVVITSGNLNLADGTEVIPRARREKKMD